ncbi:hypothetical protein ACLOJK_013984 [Asimina triloba]
MAFAKNPRTESRRTTPSHCSTVTLVVFVALCLVGVWMMTSSSVVPVQTMESPQDDAKPDMRQQVSIEHRPMQEAGSSENASGGSTTTDVANHPEETNNNADQNQPVEETNNDANQNQIPNDSGKENAPKATNEENASRDGRLEMRGSGNDGRVANSESEESNVEGGETNPKVGKGGSDGKELKLVNEETKSEGKETDMRGVDASSGVKEMSTDGGEVNSEGKEISTSGAGENLEGQGTKSIRTGETNLEGEGKIPESAEAEAESKGTSTYGGEVGSEVRETSGEGAEMNDKTQAETQEQQSDGQVEESNVENRQEGSDLGKTVQSDNLQGQMVETAIGDKGNESVQNSEASKSTDQMTTDVFPDASQSELLNETNTQNGAFSTQAAESEKEKETQESLSSESLNANDQSAGNGEAFAYSWKLCNVTAGQDYIPCLDNEEAIKKLHTTKHYEHRERHCPEVAPTCLVPLPQGYRQSIQWPVSRDKIWYFNVPHTQLAMFKGHQNWVKVTGEFLTFPGGGTQFKHGAAVYIDFLQESVPDIAWGKRSRVILDVGCGVASFGGYLFEKDVLTMSFAPKDEHEAQVQFALERGIPALSAVMGTQRLPFPSIAFDAVHCARCRVPWHIEGGKLLLELNRVLRPGGFFIWSATPVYKRSQEDVEIWNVMSELTKSMCWELVKVRRDRINEIGAAVFRKPSSNDCYDRRAENNPPLCDEKDDPNAAWNVPLQTCMHRVPTGTGERGSQWPEEWPQRLEATPYWLNESQIGVYGKPAPKDYTDDYEHWKHVVSKSYEHGMGIDWSTVRNVMDMRAVYGGFAAALREMKVWVMNIIAVDSPDTLPIIYERGLFGMYHDWCESFSTYPRTYDLLHADHLFSKLQKRCNLVAVVAEVDRILRPGGKLIVRDKIETISEVENMARSMRWEIRLTYSRDKEGLLCVRKAVWRPEEVETEPLILLLLFVCTPPRFLRLGWEIMETQNTESKLSLP